MSYRAHITGATRRILMLSLAVSATGCGGAGAVSSSASPLSPITIDGAPTPSAPSPPPSVATPAATIGGMIGAGEPWLLHDRYVGDDVKGLFLVRPDGTGDRRILDDVQGDVRAPAWSSDGSRIAFVYRGPGSAQDGEIWTAAADGSGAEKLMDGSPDCSGAFYPAWSPDDRRIAFVCYKSDGGSLAVYDVETADVTHLASFVYPEVLDNPPRWSPDGSTIAFDILHWDPTDQYLDGSLVATIAVDGGSVTRLTTFDSFAAYPDWHPNGTALVFNTYDQGNMVAASEPSNLFSIAPDGTDLRQLTTASVDGTFRITQPRWDPTGDRIWVTLWRSPEISFGWVDPRTGAVRDLGVSGARPQPRPRS